MNSEQSAMNAALRLLTRQSYSSARLEEKLREKGISQENAAAAVACCIERGYVNDRALAERLIDVQESRGYGEYRISGYLRSKGINGELIEELLEKRKNEYSPDERQEALHELCRKLHRGRVWDKKERSRLSAALARRGFSWDEISGAVREIQED